MSRHRLSHVQVDAEFTRNFTVPSFEIPVIMAAWYQYRDKITITELPDFRRIDDPEGQLNHLIGDYGPSASQVYPGLIGPGGLMAAIEKSAKETEAWLAADEVRRQADQVEAEQALAVLTKSQQGISEARGNAYNRAVSVAADAADRQDLLDALAIKDAELAAARTATADAEERLAKVKKKADKFDKADIGT